MQATSDVKCYFCGHVSGQLIGERERPEMGRFVPRAGYAGEAVLPGKRIRCERCNGPVFLEEILPMEIPFSYQRTKSHRRPAVAKMSGAA
jgi:hypothetical protein